MSQGLLANQKPNVWIDNQVLSDETKAELGLPEMATPDDAFKKLGVGVNSSLKFKLIEEKLAAPLPNNIVNFIFSGNYATKNYMFKIAPQEEENTQFSLSFATDKSVYPPAVRQSKITPGVDRFSTNSSTSYWTNSKCFMFVRFTNLRQNGGGGTVRIHFESNDGLSYLEAYSNVGDVILNTITFQRLNGAPIKISLYEVDF